MHGGLHTRSAGDVLLFSTDDQDESPHLRPVGCGSDLFGDAVASIFLCASTPGDVSSLQGTAGRARTLSGDLTEVCG